MGQAAVDKSESNSERMERISKPDAIMGSFDNTLSSQTGYEGNRAYDEKVANGFQGSIELLTPEGGSPIGPGIRPNAGAIAGGMTGFSKKINQKKSNEGGGFELNRKNNKYDIQGHPEAIVRADALREAAIAEKVAGQDNVVRTMMGQEADRFVNPNSRLGTKLSPDVVGVTKDGKYVLGEAKGRDITHALEQFEHAGKQLGVPNISRQEIIATGLPPGYAVTDLGFLTTSDGVPVIVNCKPVRVTIVGNE